MISKSLFAAFFGVVLYPLGVLEAAPRQAMRNHVPLAVRDSGRVGALARTARMDLAVGLPLRNSEEFDHLVEEVADPQSANYRHYLTVSEFTEQFGPSQED